MENIISWVKKKGKPLVIERVDNIQFYTTKFASYRDHDNFFHADIVINQFLGNVKSKVVPSTSKYKIKYNFSLVNIQPDGKFL